MRNTPGGLTEKIQKIKMTSNPPTVRHHNGVVQKGGGAIGNRREPWQGLASGVMREPPTLKKLVILAVGPSTSNSYPVLALHQRLHCHILMASVMVYDCEQILYKGGFCLFWQQLSLLKYNSSP